MIRTSWFWRLPCAALLLVFSMSGCGGSGGSKPKDAAVDRGGTGDGPSGGDSAGTDTMGATDGSGQDVAVADVPAGSDGGGSDRAPGADTGATGGTGGGTDGGSGGRDGAADAAGGTDGGTADGGADAGTPPRCQAGEACTGTFQCNASRCVRMEQEVCHCLNGSLFCGPVDCVATVDGGASDGGAADGPGRDVAAIPTCATGTATGEMCVGGTDRLCNTACVNGRSRVCFCNDNRDEWICSQPNRCP